MEPLTKNVNNSAGPCHPCRTSQGLLPTVVGNKSAITHCSCRRLANLTPSQPANIIINDKSQVCHHSPAYILTSMWVGRPRLSTSTNQPKIRIGAQGKAPRGRKWRRLPHPPQTLFHCRVHPVIGFLSDNSIPDKPNEWYSVPFI